MFGHRSDLQSLAAYDFADRNEAEIRGDWIEPLLRLLGYGLGTRHDVLRERPLQLDPPLRMIGSRRIEIDFIPTVFGHRLWIIEAKRPQGDLFSDEHLGQAWSYATDPRVAVPYIVLCDGARLGVFDVTIVDWTKAVFDHPKAELPDHFDALFELLGAPRIAEATRRRQLSHLRTALQAQVDLRALDETIADVRAIVDEVRPAVVQRRDEIREEARRSARVRGETAVRRAGMWGHAQQVNGPNTGIRWAEIDEAVEIVRGVDPRLRVREFDDIEKATTPRGQAHSRMWFPLRVVRMAAAALLCEEDGCAEHCAAIALRAAEDHATGLQADPLLAAGYRLQRLLGPLGWRMAALTKPALDKRAEELARSIDPEEWLRLDGVFGMTGYDNYKRVAHFLPAIFLNRVEWTVEALTNAADEVEAQLEQLPRPSGFEQLQPIGDPWLESWLTGDPLATMSALVIDHLPSHTESTRVKGLVSEMKHVSPN